MKYLPVTILIGALALALHAQTPAPKPEGDPFVKNAGDAAAQKKEKEEVPSSNCVVVLETYALNKDEATALLEAESGSVARYRQVLELTKAGKARLQTLTALTTKSGQRAVVEAIDEVRYATQFTSWLPGKHLPTPAAWETRNAGDTFELEPVILPDGEVCDINLVPQRVVLAGFRDEPGVPDDSPTSHPIFNTQKITTSAQVRVGEPYFLGTFTPPPVQGPANAAGAAEIWVAFLNVSVQPLPPAEGKPAMKPGSPLVNLEYSCYSLDRAAAHEILVSSSSISAPWEKVRALTGEKRAQLEFYTSVKTVQGQRAVVEESQEIRYMTEYVPASLASTTVSTTTITDPKGEASSATTSHTPPGVEHTAGHGSAFTTRNAGISVEVEPVIQPDGNVDVNQVVNNVRYLGALKVAGVATSYQPQPLFQTSKATTSLTIPPGKPTLIGTFNPPEADGVNDHADTGRTWLLFVRATLGER